MGEKKCPQCAETVQGDAKVCRYCGWSFQRSRAASVAAPKNSFQSCMGCLGLGVVGLIAMSMFGQGLPDNQSDSENAATAGASAVEAEAPELYSQETLDKARAALGRETRIRDFVLDPDNAVILQAAVDDDGTKRYGYAEYLCMVLSDAGFDMKKTVVRVVDAAQVEKSGGNFRSISLGTVQCWDQQRWD